MTTNPGIGVPQQPASRSPAEWLRLGLQAELALFRRPMLVLSVLAIVVVPSLYAGFYISSFWDPYGHLDRLPAALVNADRGAVRGERRVNLGDSVVSTFEHQPPFHFVRLPSAQAAEEALRRGEVYFALTIPPDFSERALAARSNEPANFTLRLAEGANYTSAIISKRFGAELAHTLNEQLNRERWAAIVGDTNDTTNLSMRAALSRLRDGGQKVHEGAFRVQDGSSRLDDGLNQVTDGAQRLTAGTGQFADAATQLSDGMGRVSAGVQEMRSKLPPESRLAELAAGSKSVVAGEERLGAGIDQLAAGGQRLGEGAGQLRAGAGKVPFFGGRLSDGASQLEAGISNLNTGLGQASNGSRDLHAGLEKLDGGIQPLASGLVELGKGLQTMSDQLPSAEQRNRVTNAAGELREGGAELTNGLARLRDGSQRLAQGGKDLEAGSATLAAGLDRLHTGFAEQLGDAEAGALAASVRANIEIIYPVPNNGTAFSPYFAALALWLGAIMITFIFHFRRIIEPMRAAPRGARVLAKAAVPLGLGVLQATVIVAMLRLAFGMAFAHPMLVWLAAMLGAFTFAAIILLIVTALGDAGRLVAVLLLMLQLAAAGGIYPVELSGPFYQAIHPWLPLSALVRAFRATMFDAFDGTWSTAVIQLAVTGLAAAILAMWFARWKYVPREAYGPAVDFS